MGRSVSKRARALCESIATRKRRSHRSRGLDWRRTGKGCVSCESKCSPLQSSCCLPGTGLAAERQCMFTSWSGNKQSNSSRPTDRHGLGSRKLVEGGRGPTRRTSRTVRRATALTFTGTTRCIPPNKISSSGRLSSSQRSISLVSLNLN